MSLNDFILTANYFVLAYFLVINGIYLVLYAISFAEIADYVRREAPTLTRAVRPAYPT